MDSNLNNLMERNGYEELESQVIIDDLSKNDLNVTSHSKMIIPKTEIRVFEKVIYSKSKNRGITHSIMNVRVAEKEIKTGHFTIGYNRESLLNLQAEKNGKLWSIECLSNSDDFENDLAESEIRMMNVLKKI